MMTGMSGTSWGFAGQVAVVVLVTEYALKAIVGQVASMIAGLLEPGE